MNKEYNQKSYDFTNDYRKLPIKKRVSLIKIAKKLLLQQKENSALLNDSAAFPLSGADNNERSQM